MKKISDLYRLLSSTRAKMIKDGWDEFGDDREEPCFDSLCFVAIRSIRRCNLSHLTPKAADQITMFVTHLMAFDRRSKEKTNDGVVAEKDKLNAYFCVSSLITCAFMLSTGGVWRGVDEEMEEGFENGDSALHDWVDEAGYFWDMSLDVRLGDIVQAQQAASRSK